MLFIGGVITGILLSIVSTLIFFVFNKQTKGFTQTPSFKKGEGFLFEAKSNDEKINEFIKQENIRKEGDTTNNLIDQVYG